MALLGLWVILYPSIVLIKKEEIICLILEGHLREHLGAEDMTQLQRTEEVEQVILILKSYLK